MGNPQGFIKVKRQSTEYRPVGERIKDCAEVTIARADDVSREQASRCMDCGTPFCHWGCPMGNYIPEWNDLIYSGQWYKAYELLNATNTLPEITGRVCPAPCEYSCVLGINDEAVTIRENELAIIEHAFKQGWVKPNPPSLRSGKKVAIIGSGPAGLSCAASLNRLGHQVTIFERDDALGGILRYGIPDFKLEKWVLDRRIDIWRKEGINFRTGVDIGVNYPPMQLIGEFDALCIAGGSRVPRDLPVKGRNLKGIHFAMDYLSQSNKKVVGQDVQGKTINAKDKKVIVIGGGDTGSDCVGTAHRQGAQCVVQLEVMPKPPECRSEEYPWPIYPLLLKATSSHQEGGERYWSILTKEFIGSGGHVKKLTCAKVKFEAPGDGRCPVMKEIDGIEFDIDADLVILAIGFVHPEHAGLLSDLGVTLDEKGCVKVDDGYMSSRNGIFCAGDMKRGQSLVVWAIAEGQKCACSIDDFLVKRT